MLLSHFMIHLQATNRASARAFSSGDLDFIVVNREASRERSIIPDRTTASDPEDGGSGTHSTNHSTAPLLRVVGAEGEEGIATIA